MKKIIFLSLSLMIVSMFGQFKYGFGVSLDLGPTLAGIEGVKIEPGVSLTIPLKFAGKFKVEPEIAIVSYNQTDDSTSVYKAIIMPGIGVFYEFKTKSENTVISPGLKLGLINATTENDNFDPIKYTQVSGIYFAGVLGGEYYFSENMSLGGEFQLQFESIYVTIDPDKEDYYSQFSTRSSIKLRYYFN
ncbi:MAG: hypothetical protein KAH33_01695 [Candidatus Delongbacteria bacterium]|nr:hypothetical protein [Candidatus Delongbacteria bacterium]